MHTILACTAVKLLRQVLGIASYFHGNEIAIKFTYNLPEGRSRRSFKVTEYTVRDAVVCTYAQSVCKTDYDSVYNCVRA